MAERINFTKAALTAAREKAAGRREVLHDAVVKGLIADIRAGGSMSFYVFKRVQGRPSRIRIGAFPEMTVAQARQAARVTIGEIATGKNPQAERRAARHEHTVAGLFNYWLESHAKPHKKTWKEDERQYRVFLKAWASRRLSDVKHADVQSLHARVGTKNGPYAANRLLALVRAMFNVAASIGYEGHNPAAGVKKFKEDSRDRYLQPDELPCFFKALDGEPNETLRDFFRVALFTGARRANVQSMRFEHLDVAAGVWRIPETKSGQPVLVHLSAPVVEVLTARKAAAKSEWVFPSYSKTGHLVEPKTAWKRLLDRAGLANLRPHDLRRTLGSFQAAAGASLPVIGKSLGHKSQGATAVYARLDLDPVRTAVDAATALIVAAAAAKPEEGIADDKA